MGSPKEYYTKYNKKYYQKNKQKELSRTRKYYNKNRVSVNAKATNKYHTRKGYDYELRKNYGITIDDYNKMFVEQNECCKLCGKHQSNAERKDVIKLWISLIVI